MNNVNTRISYLYRDADNEKTSTSCVLSGRMTGSLLERIISSLNEGQYFIPRAVGLPENRPEPMTSADHPYFELTKADFQPSSDATTVDMTCEELTGRFDTMRDKWDEYAKAHPLRSTEETIKAVCENLLQENDENLTDPSDVYAQGYHDALLDVLEALGCSTGRKHFD